ncbi:MAG TPA: hypothetical protein VJ784_18660 [Pyrinomonadaceae bacterium]|jgi:hypothetical protein|nr:hypothetical protein [Pyrinomonadaceae bacterium]
MNRLMIAPILLLICAAPVFSQAVPAGPPPVDRRNNDRIRQQEMSQREYNLRNFGTQPESPKNDRQLKALMAQTEEDFTRILTLHNEIARALASKKDLDYHFVSEATEEIKKRATRVQSTLRLHLSPDDAPIKEHSDAEMKDSLIKLCKEIRSFVTNPIIENPNTVDAVELPRARHDLESLIQLSGIIKKDADKLIKKD